MIRRHYITVLLLFVSILTLAVPVMPHHHHADGNICLRHDLAAQPVGPASHATHSHCCHNQGCVATHYFQRVPIVRQHVSPDQAQRLVTDFAMFFLGQSTAFYSHPLSILFTLRRIPARHVSRTCQRAARPSCRLTPSTRCLQLDCRQKCVLLRAKEWEFSGAQACL